MPGTQDGYARWESSCQHEIRDVHAGYTTHMTDIPPPILSGFINPAGEKLGGNNQMHISPPPPYSSSSSSSSSLNPPPPCPIKRKRRRIASAPSLPQYRQTTPFNPSPIYALCSSAEIGDVKLINSIFCWIMRLCRELDGRWIVMRIWTWIEKDT